jgi:membrane-bound serine protease (ClpP class)
MMQGWFETRTTPVRDQWDRLLAAVCVCLALLGNLSSQAEDAPDQAKEAQPEPIGQFVTVTGAVDDVVFGRVSRTALALQARALQEKRKGVLVLEIQPGSSPAHQVQGLAKFLTTDLPSLTTVAFVPERLTGNHVVLALACQEIIMDPAAELGDISLGNPLDADERSFVLNLVNRRHNHKVNEALALGLLDRQKEVLWVMVKSGKKPNEMREARIVSRSGYDDLARTGVEILDVKTIKEIGSPGVFSGERARGYDIIVMNTAQSREDVAALYRLPRESMRESVVMAEAPNAIIIKIEDVIDSMLEQFVLRQIDRAVASGMNMIIFEIRSPGGEMFASIHVSEAISDLSKRKIRTVAYIPKHAYSGAAIISTGCDEIYMHPDAVMGDAGVITETAKGGQFEFAPQKLMEPLERHLENMAERKHRPKALLVAMMNKDLTVYAVTNKDTGMVSYMSDDEIALANGQWVQGNAVPETGRNQLMTVNGRRAHDLHLAEVPVQDFDELQARLGVPHSQKIPTATPTWVDSLVFALNTGWALFLLVVIGLMSVYLEAHFPSGFFGIVACVCFGLFFWSHFLGGTAGWLEVVLFLIGVGCIALEIFVVPGFGVFGVSGAILCAFSLILATQTFVIPHSMADFEKLTRTLGALCGSVVGFAVLAALTSRYLPSIPLFKDMILTRPGAAAASSNEPRLRPDLADDKAFINTVLERDQGLLGKHGVAMTVLRPAGKAQIGDDYVDVVSNGPFISAGRAIEVVEVTGNRVIVREVS